MTSPTSTPRTHNHPFIDLAAGDYRASISAFGGGLHTLDYAGQPLTPGYPHGQYPPLSAGIILAPWPNRTADGVFAHDTARSTGCRSQSPDGPRPSTDSLVPWSGT
ncbi:hypothetical protein LA329_11045 [Corynebacterium falsenii]|uniref:hypothetical protein n=1 Tax=Corynebacterium falsenii TaxID=108486 RepID=UPI001CCB0DF2|nr:hypothetical protein [Corynebacterium falsenii]UBI06750.1 hypothetical protein LA329_11045 [Corynebacterium falsenii]